MSKNNIVLVFAAFILGFSCKVDPEIKQELPEVREVIPPGWPQPVYRFSDNAVSESRFALGRALFYETRLSKDNSISCGDCHQQKAAFANSGHDFSHGINNLLGTRNSPGIFNLTWHPSFMHDGGINHIELQPVAPITNSVEMGETMFSVVEKLNDDERYRALFKASFGSEEVTSANLQKALAQFMALMYSYNSKYDKIKRGEGIASFTEEEKKGYALFVARCASCHDEPLFTDFEYRNNGLAPVLGDVGRELITQERADRYKFKTPSLRNIAVTKPYMHDGRYATLEECLDHYTSGVKNHENLDPLLQNDYGISLNAGEKKDIIAFLHTLTDFEFLNDERFSDPNFR